MQPVFEPMYVCQKTVDAAIRFHIGISDGSAPLGLVIYIYIYIYIYIIMGLGQCVALLHHWFDFFGFADRNYN